MRRAGRRRDADAEKLADLELDARAADGLRSAVLDAAVEEQALYKPGADLFAARSFAGQEPADAAAERERPDVQLVQLGLTAPSRPAEGPQERSPPAVPHAELPELLEH